SNMSKTLNRRGPDESGEYITDHVALLHRRLSVVDIKNGKQPMHKIIGGREYVITYNGELYNSDEIRRELRVSGHDFNGHSDTEVLLLSYIEWGESCLHRLNGIFAFAIYDVTRDILFMARDRAGVKPLFYHEYSGGLVFGSEIKTLLENPKVSRRVDKYGIAEVFLIGPGRTPGETAFKDIEELKPGWSATYKNGKLNKYRYWRIEATEHEDSMAATIEKLEYLITDSIKRQLVSDVPLCCFLSGGLDSSIISSIAAEKFKSENAQLTTYSVDYEDNEKYFKESYFQPNSDDYFIDIMVKNIGSEHKKVILDNDDVGNMLREATLARDLPGMADIDSSLLMFCERVKKTHTVALSGECADEIFGGYPWYTNQETLARADFPWSGNTDIKSSLVNKAFMTFDPKDYVYERYSDSIKNTPKTGLESELDSRIKEITTLNLNWFMQTLLERKDRMSMYSGLEVRVPFCDHRIMQYAYNIPWEMKSYAGREKGLLRKVFSGRLPDEITYRKKSPYPKSHNPIYVENVRAKVKRIIENHSSPLLEIVDRSALKSLLDTDAEIFTKPWYGQLMNFPQIMGYMYMIDTWLTEYKVDIN
ncbi:MAG: asparagine synthase (glutamine-hydrolyzing), partial [Oscillospiraceae bacterium]